MRLSHILVSLIAPISIMVQCLEFEDVLKHELDKNQVNITTRDNMIPFINQYRLSTQEQVGLGMILFGEAGITLGGIIPYCTNSNYGAATFGSTTNCAIALFSGLVMFNGILLGLFGSKLDNKLFNNPKLELDPPILSNNWSNITKSAYERGFEIDYLYYKNLKYDSGEVLLLEDFYVVYSVDGLQINHRFNNDDLTYKEIAFKPVSFLTSMKLKVKNFLSRLMNT
ncbi:putative membrane protein [Wickerhamomyces ciferrii]|uniref:Membrane protein n=1 Tax=Wickerhamomyces ciferrii (strain ATCC 14091 / BCRC 22168 / CBS 111 / JCM 3599 / NBRC 0793 / NRRL Y-1031 F-60-10) TaxID=1206466 RepID=K0KJZ4_WICCF|nr:uncharacterized protein BN7_5162 [Wickerhamomyces ciferrii]CCH45580.1 putative membrane protein [Wickerhamomyces ciferrii]